METLTINLPAEIKDFVEEQAVREGSSVSEYLGDILREARERDRGLGEVRAKLLEAIEEPATPMTRADWDELRREIRDRHAPDRESPDAGSPV